MGSRRIGIGHYNALRMYLCCKNTIFFQYLWRQKTENNELFTFFISPVSKTNTAHSPALFHAVNSALPTSRY